MVPILDMSLHFAGGKSADVEREKGCEQNGDRGKIQDSVAGMPALLIARERHPSLLHSTFDSCRGCKNGRCGEEQ